MKWKERKRNVSKSRISICLSLVHPGVSSFQNTAQHTAGTQKHFFEWLRYFPQS
jgi:hypothetical protein